MLESTSCLLKSVQYLDTKVYLYCMDSNLDSNLRNLHYNYKKNNVTGTWSRHREQPLITNSWIWSISTPEIHADMKNLTSAFYKQVLSCQHTGVQILTTSL